MGGAAVWRPEGASPGPAPANEFFVRGSSMGMKNKLVLQQFIYTKCSQPCAWWLKREERVALQTFVWISVLSVFRVLGY